MSGSTAERASTSRSPTAPKVLPKHDATYGAAIVVSALHAPTYAVRFDELPATPPDESASLELKYLVSTCTNAFDARLKAWCTSVAHCFRIAGKEKTQCLISFRLCKMPLTKHPWLKINNCQSCISRCMDKQSGQRE